MRIGIDAFSLIPGEGKGSGGYVYFTNLINQLSATDLSNQYFLYKNAYWEPNITQSNWKIITVKLDSKKKYLRFFFQNVYLPFLAKKDHLDVIHFPFNVCTIAPILSCRKVVTIHDTVCFFRKKKWPKHTTMTDRYLRAILPIILRSCDSIIAVSNFTKKEVVRYCRVNPDQITVIYEAPGHFKSKSQFPSPFDSPYFLTVASDSPQKNLLNYIKAISLLPKRFLSSHKFVICGMIRERSHGLQVGKDKLREAIKANNLNGIILLLGFLPEQELVALYQNAFAIVYPSIYEGFGLPILEAFSFNKPLLCSDAASLKEIGGSAACYFDPENPVDIANKLLFALNSKHHLDQLVNAGRQRLFDFSWKKCARKTSQVYEGRSYNK